MSGFELIRKPMTAVPREFSASPQGGFLLQGLVCFNGLPPTIHFLIGLGFILAQFAERSRHPQVARFADLDVLRAFNSESHGLGIHAGHNHIPIAQFHGDDSAFLFFTRLAFVREI